MMVERLRGWLRRRSTREAAVGVLLLLPVLFFLGLVIAWPLVRAIWLSFHRLYLLKGLDSIEWAGLDNFRTFLQNPRTPSYFKNVLTLLVGTVVARRPGVDGLGRIGGREGFPFPPDMVGRCCPQGAQRHGPPDRSQQQTTQNERAGVCVPHARRLHLSGIPVFQHSRFHRQP